MKPRKLWKKETGFTARRVSEFAFILGYRLTVSNMERVNGNWRRSTRWHAFVDQDYVGDAGTLDGAKLAAILMVTT